MVETIHYFPIYLSQKLTKQKLQKIQAINLLVHVKIWLFSYLLGEFGFIERVLGSATILEQTFSYIFLLALAIGFAHLIPERLLMINKYKK